MVWKGEIRMNPFDAKQAAEVWSRVTAAGKPQAQPEPPSIESELSDMLRDELADRAAYAQLARRTRGECAQALRAIARDEGGHAKKLTALCFLHTGKKPEAESAPARLTGSLADSLRGRYELETAGAELYRRAAEQYPAHRALFERLSADERRHSEAVLHLLENCL